ncbi:hypothetical protein K3495_g16876, partial [Podosphaera aphanis]
MSVISISLEDAYTPTYEYEEFKAGHKIDVGNNELLTELFLNGYIVHFIRQHKHQKYRDENLWEEYVEYFGGWTKETFEIPSRSAVVNLRDYLRRNGVFVLKAARISVA